MGTFTVIVIILAVVGSFAAILFDAYATRRR